MQVPAYGENNSKGGNIPSSLAQFVAPAQILQDETGIPASITLAQIILESGTTLSGLAQKAKNLFGIKGTGPAGSVYMPTHEVVNGTTKTVMAQFRAYHTYLESMEDHARLLSTDRYAKYFKNAKTVDDYAYALQKAGYATDPNYAQKLIQIIQKYNLHAYDDGNIQFKGLSGNDSSDTEKNTLIGKLFYSILHAVLIILLFVGFIYFFTKSFPPLEERVSF
jgi:flagellum-specific peptidoglycan hydrolase FlgJ